jgi:limonene-1,2-epoxide hydrolase
MMQPVAVVEAFVAAWNRMDFDAIIAALDENVRYHNIPLQPIQGREAVRAYLQEAWRFDEVDWQLTHAAADGNVVLTERIDNFVINGRPVSLPIMGAFEVRDGRIVAWRDYFDLSDYRAQLDAAS